jgi:hypothetical protein
MQTYAHREREIIFFITLKNKVCHLWWLVHTHTHTHTHEYTRKQVCHRHTHIDTWTDTHKIHAYIPMHKHIHTYLDTYACLSVPEGPRNITNSPLRIGYCSCVCMYVCMCMYVYPYPSLVLSMRMYVYTYVCTYVLSFEDNVDVHVHTTVDVYVRTYECVCVHVWGCVCMYVCMHACMMSTNVISTCYISPPTRIAHPCVSMFVYVYVWMHSIYKDTTTSNDGLSPYRIMEPIHPNLVYVCESQNDKGWLMSRRCYSPGATTAANLWEQTPRDRCLMLEGKGWWFCKHVFIRNHRDRTRDVEIYNFCIVADIYVSQRDDMLVSPRELIRLLYVRCNDHLPS